MSREEMIEKLNGLVEEVSDDALKTIIEYLMEAKETGSGSERASNRILQMLKDDKGLLKMLAE